jgi:hypothetical protein
VSRGAGDTFEVVTRSTKPREFIALGIPSFGTVDIFWAVRAFGQLRHPMNRDVRQYVILGDEVGLARNEIVAKALAVETVDPTKRCSHVFFVDDDVYLHPEAMLKLLHDDLPIVSGLYFAKTAVPQALVLVEDGVERKWNPGEIVDCWAHGMGMTMIVADVFRRLRDETDLGTDERGNPNWFQTTKDAQVLNADGVPAFVNQTEDVAFLRKAAALGYQPRVDTGPQTFGFHFSRTEQRGYPLKQWFEFQREGRITWTDTPDGVPVVWENA